jgi:hypothetical protein
VDITAGLASAAEAARRTIHHVALGEVEHGAFPPRPHHINKAGAYLTELRTRALALAARAEVVRAEIECYLDTAEPEDDRAPGCQCTDGNCDNCLTHRRTTETE